MYVLRYIQTTVKIYLYMVSAQGSVDSGKLLLTLSGSLLLQKTKKVLWSSDKFIANFFMTKVKANLLSNLVP